MYSQCTSYKKTVPLFSVISQLLMKYLLKLDSLFLSNNLLHSAKVIPKSNNKSNYK